MYLLFIHCSNGNYHPLAAFLFFFFGKKKSQIDYLFSHLCCLFEQYAVRGGGGLKTKIQTMLRI